MAQSDDLDKTPITCLACGGRHTTTRYENGRHSTLFCQFCTLGSMVPSQVEFWRQWRASQLAKRRNDGGNHGKG